MIKCIQKIIFITFLFRSFQLFQPESFSSRHARMSTVISSIYSSIFPQVVTGFSIKSIDAINECQCVAVIENQTNQMNRNISSLSLTISESSGVNSRSLSTRLCNTFFTFLLSFVDSTLLSRKSLIFALFIIWTRIDAISPPSAYKHLMKAAAIIFTRPLSNE